MVAIVLESLIKSKLYNSPCNKIIRKDFLKKNGISFNNLPLIEDVDFVNQLMLKKPNIRLIDHCLYKYKIEDSRIDSISSRYYKERFEMSVKMNLDYMNVLKKYKSDDLEMLNYIGAKLLQDMYKVFWHEYVVFSNEKGKEQKEVELRSLLRNKGLINQIKKSKANCTSENIFKKCLCFGNGTIIKGYFRIRKIFYVYKHK